MSLTLAMEAGISGLMSSQQAISTTSNNISNVNTVGYSRKIYNQESVVVAGISQGVKSLVNTRSIDMSLQRDLFRESGTNNTLAIINDYSNRVLDLFGEPSANNSLAHTVSSLQGFLETLSTSPDNYSSQADFVNNLEKTFSQINNTADYLQNLRLESDRQVSSYVTEINTILEQLDKLNEDIMKVDVVGLYSSDDLKDQRDLLMGELSEIIDIDYFFRETGEVVITTAAGDTLLDENVNELSFTGATHLSAWTTKDGGEIPGIFLNGKDITSSISSGQLKGLIDIRDDVLPDIQAQLDELTYQMTEVMNDINNQGVSFASPSSEMTGTRNFISPETQSINISSGEVRIVVFDKEGNAVSSTALVSDLGFSEGVIYDEATHPSTSSGTLASTIENWLTTSPDGPQLSQAKVGVDEGGNFFVDLGSSEYSIAFRDEETSVLGSEQQNVTIEFDSDGDVVSGGHYDTEYSGFSNFLGLNDLLVGRSSEWLYDSNIVPSSYQTSNTKLGVINFSFDGDMNAYQLEVTSGMSLNDIANKINSDSTINDDIKAQVIQEGDGYRLRIEQIDGKQMEVTELSDTNILASLGLKASACGLSNITNVNPVIKENPSKVSVGAVQFDTTSGKYYVSAGDNTTAQKLSEAFSSNESFNAAGSVSAGQYNFSDYSSSIVSQVSTFYNTNNTQFTYQSSLVSSLQTKNAEVSGVNLDEELAMLIVFERSYNAAARVISTVDEMLQTLENMV